MSGDADKLICSLCGKIVHRDYLERHLANVHGRSEVGASAGALFSPASAELRRALRMPEKPPKKKRRGHPAPPRELKGLLKKHLAWLYQHEVALIRSFHLQLGNGKALTPNQRRVVKNILRRVFLRRRPKIFRG